MIEVVIGQKNEIPWEFIVTIVTVLASAFAIVISLQLAKKQRTADIITKNRMEWIQEFRSLFGEYYKNVAFYEDKQIPQDIDQHMNMIYLLEGKLKLHLNCFGAYDSIILMYMKLLNSKYEALLYRFRLMKKTKDKLKISADMLEYIHRTCPDIISALNKDVIAKYGLDEMKSKNDYSKLTELLNSSDFQEENVKRSLELESQFSKTCAAAVRYLPELILIYVQIYLKVEWDRVKHEAKKGKSKGFNFDAAYEKYLKKRTEEINKLRRLLVNVLP